MLPQAEVPPAGGVWSPGRCRPRRRWGCRRCPGRAAPPGGPAPGCPRPTAPAPPPCPPSSGTASPGPAGAPAPLPPQHLHRPRAPATPTHPPPERHHGRRATRGASDGARPCPAATTASALVHSYQGTGPRPAARRAVVLVAGGAGRARGCTLSLASRTWWWRWSCGRGLSHAAVCTGSMSLPCSLTSSTRLPPPPPPPRPPRGTPPRPNGSATFHFRK